MVVPRRAIDGAFVPDVLDAPAFYIRQKQGFERFACFFVSLKSQLNFFEKIVGTKSETGALFIEKASQVKTETELIEGCRQYKLSAQEELYKRYAPRLRAMCKQYLKDNDQISDVLQEGFLKIFKHIGDFKSEGSFEGWMKRIVYHTALQQIKKNKKYASLYSSEEIHVLEEHVSAQEELATEDHLIDRTDVTETISYGMIERAEFTKEELMECLRTLKHEFMMVFQLYYIKGMAHQEIAELLFIDENTSRTRLFRARKLMQEELYKRSIHKLTV